MSYLNLIIWFLFSPSNITTDICFIFSGLLPTTEAMGIWRFAGAFTVAQRQSECGRKTLQIARQPACDHRRVLAVRCLVFNSFYFRNNLKFSQNGTQ